MADVWYRIILLGLNNTFIHEGAIVIGQEIGNLPSWKLKIK